MGWSVRRENFTDHETSFEQGLVLALLIAGSPVSWRLTRLPETFRL